MSETDQRTILVVDDEEDVLELAAIVLRDDGYHVEKARNGHEALDLLANLDPDLILLDLRMPGMNGIQFVTEYRARVNHVAPVVLMTASLHPDREAAEVGAVGWLAKPFDLNTLSETVRRYLCPDAPS